MSKRAWGAAVITVAVMLTAAGCGSESNTASGPTGSLASGQVAGEPISVGVICNCSGSFGTSVDPGRKVVEAWAQNLNEKGGIGGHPIKLTVKDDASNPGTSVSMVQELINDEVQVIVDLSALDSAWAKAAQSAGIPVVGGAINTLTFFQNPNFYPSGMTADAVLHAHISTAKKAGAKSIGRLYCSESPSCIEGNDELRKIGDSEGVPLVYTAAIAATAPNYTAECLAAKDAGVQALLINQTAAVIQKVADECARQGYEPTYLNIGTSFSDALSAHPVLKDKLWGSFPSLPYFADADAAKEMRQVLDKYQPGLMEDDKAWTQYGVQAWGAGKLIEQAVDLAQASGSAITASDILKGLNSMKDETLNGLSPPLTFADGQPHPVKCWFTARVAGGKPQLVDDGKVSCAS